jgi:radical SAM superfamily enzyme YgiQ (UPF0313 family)
MRKDQNLMVPMLESIQTLNSYGLEVTAGMIIGLDTDSDETEHRVMHFIDDSQIPILTLNLLQALPKTPLWDRLAREGRIVNDPRLESNVRFHRPHDEVVASWRRCVAHAYAPERLYARFRHQVEFTYPNRQKPPARARLTVPNLKRGATLAYNIATTVGWRADYRKDFWRAARPALRRGQIDAALGMGFVGHHLIQFTREAMAGRQNASFYSAKPREAEMAPAVVT